MQSRKVPFQRREVPLLEQRSTFVGYIFFKKGNFCNMEKTHGKTYQKSNSAPGPSTSLSKCRLPLNFRICYSFPSMGQSGTNSGDNEKCSSRRRGPKLQMLPTSLTGTNQKDLVAAYLNSSLTYLVIRI